MPIVLTQRPAEHLSHLFEYLLEYLSPWQSTTKAPACASRRDRYCPVEGTGIPLSDNLSTSSLSSLPTSSNTHRLYSLATCEHILAALSNRPHRARTPVSSTHVPRFLFIRTPPPPACSSFCNPPSVCQQHSERARRPVEPPSSPEKQTHRPRIHNRAELILFTLIALTPSCVAAYKVGTLLAHFATSYLVSEQPRHTSTGIATIAFRPTAACKMTESASLPLHVKHPAAQPQAMSEESDARPATTLAGSRKNSSDNKMPLSSSPGLQNPKKPSITGRLTRMFSQTGKPPAHLAEKHWDAPKEGSSSTFVTNGSAVNGVRSQASSRASNHSDKRSDNSTVSERNMSVVSTKKEVNPQEPLPRFRMVDDSHEHYLKSAKRQEKLGDMLRDMLGAKKKDPEGDEHQQLSLMSSWVDQLKNEREKLAADKKGGPNHTATLVEKYGKCREIVGRGAFGIVRIAHKPDPKDSKNEKLYAVKEFRRRPSESPKKYFKRLTSEFCISSKLEHPNVVRTLDLLQDAKGDYCEVMEFCAGGDLYTLVLAATKLEVAEADCYFKQLMRGVEFIHEMGVAHRDLKPENLLLTTHGALKITDFGNGECFRTAWEKDAHMTAGLCGSAPYIAPEEYLDKEFDPRAVDVWATGVIYMAMRTGRHLWRVAKKDEDEFFERYLEGRKADDGYQPIETLHRVSISSCSSHSTCADRRQARCRNVIYSILDPNPTRRITASQVLKSEWGREIKVCKAGEEGF